ncbi:MAG: dolichol kinase [Natronomonas sp.]
MAFELRRRLVHASGAVVPLAYLLDARFGVGVVSWRVVQLIAILGVVAVIVLEAARLYGGLEHAIYDQLTRAYEQDSVAGYALYVFGGATVVWLFEPQIAVPALFMLTIGDPVSGLLSNTGVESVKRPRVLAGMFVTCFLLAVSFVGPVAAAAGALAATVGDGVKPTIGDFVVDDNLSIPILGAVAMWVVLLIA